MELHVKILAAFHLVFGVLGLIVALAVLLIFGGAASVAGVAGVEEPDVWIAMPILAIAGSAILLAVLTLSIPGIIAGFGLLKFRPWARILAIVLSATGLINFPFGTVVGIYGLWVLLSPETERLFIVPPPPPASMT